MFRYLKIIYRLVVTFGIDPRATFNAFRGLSFYFRDLRILKKQQKASPLDFPFYGVYPRLGERFLESGSAKGAYFHQDLLVARRIFLQKPNVHVDVGSRIDGFVAHVATFREILVFDIREMTSKVTNVKFICADLMSDLSDKITDYCDSLSCLHALEHFGLGRYGDPVNYEGHIRGLDNLYKILKKGGKLYLSIPIGPQHIEFNAHRVFSIQYLISLLDGKYSIDFFSYVDDKGDLHENVKLTEDNILNNFNCNFGCGIFEMTKL